jgi:hypothetical protein
MTKKEQWERYCSEHLTSLTPILLGLGYTLESEQPHLIGERYLLSGPKLVLFGERTRDHLPVVIKVTDDTGAAQDLMHERACREALGSIDFAYQVFRSPRDILFGKHDRYTLSITEYIEQKKPFLERTLEEQFFLALKAFEAQEASHATTAKHLNTIRSTFEIYDAQRYIRTLAQYRTQVCTLEQIPLETTTVLDEAVRTLEEGQELLDRYAGFLTHWDFVPHNIRIRENEIYLLDHTAIRFGNKYEGWARFMNFMTLYHPQLEMALDRYVHENRRAEEHETLRLMRIYRLSELVWLYATKRASAVGDLQTLTDARIALWTSALNAQLTHTPLADEILTGYKKTRDTLRDPEEKKRQIGLH